MLLKPSTSVTIEKYLQLKRAQADLKAHTAAASS